MKVDLNKSYKTALDYEVKLYEIVDGIVIGAYKDPSRPDFWAAGNWNIKGEKLDNQGRNCISDRYDLKEVPKFECLSIYTTYFDVKLVYYMGVSFYIPKRVKYIATDLCGSVFGYDYEPQLKDDYWTSSLMSTNYSIRLTSVNYIGDWKESMEKV